MNIWWLIHGLLYSVGLYFCIGILCVGLDCYHHGDIGPYPLSAWADKYLIYVAGGIGFVISFLEPR